MSAAEIDRTLQRLAHQIVEKSGGTRHLALIGIRRRGVPLASASRRPCAASMAWRCPSARWTSRCTATISQRSLRRPCCNRRIFRFGWTPGSGPCGRRALHRTHDPRRHERAVRSRPAETRFSVRADRPRPPRNAHRGAVHGPHGPDQRHRNYRSAAYRKSITKSAWCWWTAWIPDFLTAVRPGEIFAS